MDHNELFTHCGSTSLAIRIAWPFPLHNLFSNVKKLREYGIWNILWNIDDERRHISCNHSSLYYMQERKGREWVGTWQLLSCTWLLSHQFDPEESQDKLKDCNENIPQCSRELEKDLLLEHVSSAFPSLISPQHLLKRPSASSLSPYFSTIF